MGNKRVIVAVAALIGLLTGLAIGGQLIGRDGDAQSGSAPASDLADPGWADLTAEIESLRDEIADERAGRFTLGAEVDQLRWALEQLAPNLPRVERAGTETLPLSDAKNETESETSTTAATHEWFDESQFLAAGFDDDEIERLRTIFDEYKMEELYLRDQAAREGWAGRGRLRVETQEIRNALRAEIGDPAYDVMLYATGANNRVRLVSTLASSPARAADLQPGDLILRYAGENVFRPADLQQASRRGKAGASVAVDVLRKGETIRFYLPRGPLGARLALARSAPTRFR